MEELQQKIMSMTAGKQPRILFMTAVKKKAGFQKSTYNDAALWALSDSLLDSKPAGIGRTMNTAISII